MARDCSSMVRAQTGESWPSRLQLNGASARHGTDEVPGFCYWVWSSMVRAQTGEWWPGTPDCSSMVRAAPDMELMRCPVFCGDPNCEAMAWDCEASFLPRPAPATPLHPAALPSAPAQPRPAPPLLALLPPTHPIAESEPPTRHRTTDGDI